MANQHMALPAVALLAFICALAGCSSQTTKRDGFAHTYKVPPGVDSTVAREADSVSTFLYVKPKTETKIAKLKARAQERFQRSDSLWFRVHARKTVSEGDSATAAQLLQNGKSAIDQVAALSGGKDPGTLDKETSAKINKYLDEAIRAIEEAIALNPFDAEARNWLARIYKVRADRFESRRDYESAAKALENLQQLDRSNHLTYYRLAENYYHLKAWQPSYEAFLEAENVLRTTAFVGVTNPDASLNDLKNAPVDTASLFIYRFYQGITQARLYNAAEALRILASAADLAATPEQRLSVVDYMDWINWDDGNIRGSEIRDSLLVLQNRQRFQAAAEGFQKLAPSLKTQRARDEIEWRAAVLQYQPLGKSEAAVKSLHNLISRTAKDASGAPVDTSYQQYFEDYSTICYNLGLEQTRERKWQQAYAYFRQASSISWKGRAKSHVEIAKIVQNNPDLVIEHCQRAKKEEGALTAAERRELYQLLSVAYLKKGMADQAREARHNWLKLQRTDGANDATNLL